MVETARRGCMNPQTDKQATKCTAFFFPHVPSFEKTQKKGDEKSHLPMARLLQTVTTSLASMCSTCGMVTPSFHTGFAVPVLSFFSWYVLKKQKSAVSVSGRFRSYRDGFVRRGGFVHQTGFVFGDGFEFRRFRLVMFASS